MKAALPCVLVAFFVTSCNSVPIWEDETPVKIEAIVRAYAPDTIHLDFSDGRYSTTHLFASDLDIVSPRPRFEHRLRVSSLRELEGSNPLTHVGAHVAFTVPRKYLVEILSDPTKMHDSPFLYVESVIELREVQKAPNQLPETTRGK